MVSGENQFMSTMQASRITGMAQGWEILMRRHWYLFTKGSSHIKPTFPLNKRDVAVESTDGNVQDSMVLAKEKKVK
jgi:hypothetical protein